jgi:hypothetical protein
MCDRTPRATEYRGDMKPTDRESDDAARSRVAALFEHAARVNLGVVVVAAPDATRAAARDVATSAAIEAGRSSLLREATAGARETVLQAFAGAGFSGTWAATEMSVSVASASDRVAAVAAFEEATIAAVAEDLIDEDTFEVLNSTWTELVNSGAIPSPGSLASVASPGLGMIRGPIQIAILAAVVLVCAFMALATASVSGLIVVFFAVGIVAALARRWSQPVP